MPVAAAVIAAGPVVKSFKKLANGTYYTDRVLIRTRDKIVNDFKSAGYEVNDSKGQSMLIGFKLNHSAVPNRKIGQTYDREFTRLYEYVKAVMIRNGRKDLVPMFEQNVPLFAPLNHDTTLLKEIIQANKPMALVDFLNNAGEVINKGVEFGEKIGSTIGIVEDSAKRINQTMSGRPSPSLVTTTSGSSTGLSIEKIVFLVLAAAAVFKLFPKLFR